MISRFVVVHYNSYLYDRQTPILCSMVFGLKERRPNTEELWLRPDRQLVALEVSLTKQAASSAYMHLLNDECNYIKLYFCKYLHFKVQILNKYFISEEVDKWIKQKDYMPIGIGTVDHQLRYKHTKIQWRTSRRQTETAVTTGTQNCSQYLCL